LERRSPPDEQVVSWILLVPPNSQKLRVLFVPDSIYWVTGTISKSIAAHNPWIEATICSGTVVQQLWKRGVDLAAEVDVVHFLTTIDTVTLLPRFKDRVACVTSVHHIHDWDHLDCDIGGDAIMTVCSQWEREIIARGVPAEAIVRLANGVEAETFHPASPPEKQSARQHLGLPPGAVVVGFFGKKGSDDLQRKGTDVFVQAMKLLHQSMPQAAALIVGPGWHETAEALAADKIPFRWVPFAFEHEDVAELYHALDFYWVTSRIEGGPVPLLEAMASGICCVATPVGMAPEVIRSGENAVIVPFDDPAAIVEITCNIVRNPELRAHLQASARQTIVEEHTWARTVKSAENLYDLALERFARRRSLPVQPRVFAMEASSPAPSLRSPVPLSAVPASWHSFVRTREVLQLARWLASSGHYQEARRLCLGRLLADPLAFRLHVEVLRSLLPRWAFSFLHGMRQKIKPSRRPGVPAKTADAVKDVAKPK
jgi:glycosyltransferase involved in cell wall biosynthesis